MARAPDYSLISRRGETIANGIQQSFNIIAQTVPNVVKEYKNNRSLENTYNIIKKNVFENQEKYGFTDKEAESVVGKLKYNENESIESYEKRVAPTLSNFMIWEKYTEDPNYEVELPNPFVDTGTFIKMLDMGLERKGQKEVGEAVARELAGGTTVLAGEAGPVRPEAKTQEELQSRVAGRLGAGVPVEQKQFERFPAYRSLPSEADIQRQRQTQAQIEATQALTEQRKQTTTEKLKDIAGAEDKKAAVQNLKDYNTVVRMKIAASESLKNLKPEIGDEPSEAYLDMMQTLEEVKRREKEILKQGGVAEPQKTEGQKIASFEAGKIEESIDRLTKGADMSEEEKIRFKAKSAQEFANARGVNIDYNRVLAALKQGIGLDEIIENIYKAVDVQQPVPPDPAKRSGRVGSTGAPVPNIGGRIGG